MSYSRYLETSSSEEEEEEEPPSKGKWLDDHYDVLHRDGAGPRAVEVRRGRTHATTDDPRNFSVNPRDFAKSPRRHLGSELGSRAVQMTRDPRFSVNRPNSSVAA